MHGNDPVCVLCVLHGKCGWVVFHRILIKWMGKIVCKRKKFIVIQ